MNRSTLKVIGLALLIPGLLVGVLPLVASYTSFLAGVAPFDFRLGNFAVASLEHHGKVSEAVVTPFAWVAAASGELLLIWIHLTRPQVASRFDINAQ